MTARSIRRAAKLARKQAKQVEALASIPALAEEESDAFREMKRNLYEKALRQIEARQSAPETPPHSRRCTGPVTTEGKAISSLNRPSAQGVLLPVVRGQESAQGVSLPVVRGQEEKKHGLTGVFRVLESESQNLFDELRDTLRNEHAPATATETLLVDRMAEHIWLSQRAQRLQDHALFESNEQSFALYLRYQTTNDRGFHKCLRELATIRRERQQFESQNQEERALPATPVEIRSVDADHAAKRNDRKIVHTGSSNRKTGFPPLNEQYMVVCPSPLSSEASCAGD